MNITDIHEFAAAAKKIAAESKATGPRSEKGKLRSSLNAVKNGLSGKHMLLPGEDAEEYGRKMDGAFVSLAPKNDGEAQLVALIADDLHKLDRLSRIEQGLTLGRIEELLGLTSTAEATAATTNLIATFGRALTKWEEMPLPTKPTLTFISGLDALNEAVDLVGSSAAITIPAELIAACNRQFIVLRDPLTAEGWFAETCADVDQTARTIMTKLMEAGDRDEAAQETLRRAIATIALPDEAELKKLGRYRKILEDGLQRRLQALDQIRELTAASTATSEAADRSREYRVKLRLVV